MSSQAFASPLNQPPLPDWLQDTKPQDHGASLVPAELPDWILALKPPDADTAQVTESALFSSLDLELESLMQASPDDVSWLADVAEQTTHLISRDEADAILEGKVKPARLPRPRRRRAARLRQDERIALDIVLVIVILALLATLFILRYAALMP